MAQQVISIIDRHQFRQTDPSPLGAPRQLAPSYDRVRWLTALVEEFGPKFVASFHFTPYGKWVYETWVSANPREKKLRILGPRPADRPNLKLKHGFCFDCQQPYAKYRTRVNDLCSRCATARRVKRYQQSEKGKAKLAEIRARRAAKNVRSVNSIPQETTDT